MKWYEKLHRELKKGWDRYLRPVVEPVLRGMVAARVGEEIQRRNRG